MSKENLNCSGQIKSCKMNLGDKVIIGSVEYIKIKEKVFPARVDTGATSSSIARKLVDELELGPTIGEVEIKNDFGKKTRKVILIDVELAGKKKKKVRFNISNRARMRFPILIGRNLLKEGFLVDCSNENRNY